MASVFAFVAPTGAPAQQPPVVLRAATVLDGLGATLRDRDVVIRDRRIDEIVPAGQGTSRAEDAVLYDLGDLTLLPGLIDTHVHIGWHFDRTGRTPSRAVEETPEEAILYGAENAWLTLMGGVTTVQSVGAGSDAELRDAIARGVLPGPRILTSLISIGAGTGDPAEIRARVRELADAGADVIKIFASASIRVGGTPTLSLAQLQAACGEATARGLRTSRTRSRARERATLSPSRVHHHRARRPARPRDTRDHGRPRDVL